MLGHCKLCEAEDFRDPDLVAVIRDVHKHELDANPSYPEGREHRKQWEVAMTARAFRDLGVLREDAQVLGVGAGREATLFWLTERVGRVVATDLYASDDAWSETDSGASMLADPGANWPGTFNPGRLDVEHMDALDLKFPDESFDAIFSSSSIEHFGTYTEVRRSVEEMYRVLKPGGVVALATEFRLRGFATGLQGTNLFSAGELRDCLLRGLDWEPTDPLRFTVSAETRAGRVSYSEAQAATRAGGSPKFPHLLLEEGPFRWTSVHFALVKSGDPRPPAASARRRVKIRSAMESALRQPKRIQYLPSLIRERRERRSAAR